MKKSIGNAFLFMFKDKDWYKKAGILAVLYFIVYVIACSAISILPTLLQHTKEANLNAQMIRLLMPIGTLITFFIIGYITKCTHNVINNNGQENILLPDWKDDFFNYFILGAKRIGGRMGVCVLLLPTILLLGIPFLIFWLLTIPLGRIFCTEFEFDSYFKWKKAYELIKNNIGLYVWIFLIMLMINLMNILLFVALFYFKVTSGLNAIIMAITTTYLALVFAYLVGIVGDKKQLTLESQ